MPQRLVLVRHAQSTNNDLYARTGARTGRVPDPLLSPYGQRQAAAVAAALGADPRLATAPVWASPTARAVQTGAALVRAGVGTGASEPQGELVLVPDLVEGGGIYERPGDGDGPGERVAVDGLPLDGMQELAGPVRVRWVDDEAAGWGGGFEEHDAIAPRAARLLAAVRGSGHPVLVAVSHEWFAQHVIRAALGLPPGNEAADRGWFAVPNASITEILLDEGTAELCRLGDVHHLDGLAATDPRHDGTLGSPR